MLNRLVYTTLVAMAALVLLFPVLWRVPALRPVLANWPAPHGFVTAVWMPRFSGCSILQTARDAKIDLDRNTIVERAIKAVRRVSRDGDGYSLWETPYGRMWMPNEDGAVVAQLVSERQRETYPVCKPGEVVLDCGAHVGFYAREALDAGAVMVVAIEPAPRNLEALRRNLAPEIAQGRVVIYPKGVWDRGAVLHLSQSGDSVQDSVVFERGHEGPTVPLTTVDDITAELRLRRVDAIKLDIEGAERRALQGARRTIREHRPRLIIASYHLRDDPDVILGLISSVRSDYRLSCRFCSNWFGRWRVAPEVMVFE